MLKFCKKQALQQLQIEFLAERSNSGSKDLNDRIKDLNDRMTSGFNKTDRWLMLLVGAVSSLLKSYFQSD
jgi:hypothetical protein